MRKIFFCAFLILLINSAYLFSFGEPTLFYILNVLFHVGLGVALIIPFGIYAYQQFKRIPTLGQVGIIGIIVGIISGGYLMVVGATTPYRWLLITHIISISAGSILFCIYLFRDTELLTPLFKKISIGVLIVVVLFPIGAKLTQHYLPNETYLVENPALPPTSMYEEGGGTTGHFFPASVETETGGLIPTDFFLTSETCATKAVTQTSTGSGTNPLTISPRSITSGIANQSSICRRSTAFNPRNGAADATTPQSYSTVSWTDPSVKPSYTRRASRTRLHSVPLHRKSQRYDGQQLDM